MHTAERTAFQRFLEIARSTDRRQLEPDIEADLEEPVARLVRRHFPHASAKTVANMTSYLVAALETLKEEPCL